MARRSKFSQEIRERAVRMVVEHRGQYGSQWEAITSIAEKIGCSAEAPLFGLFVLAVSASRRIGYPRLDRPRSRRSRARELERQGTDIEAAFGGPEVAAPLGSCHFGALSDLDSAS
jgi:hypothetical protein